MAQACYDMMAESRQLLRKPLLILGVIFPGMIKYLQLINPTLGMKFDVAAIVEQKFKSILEVSEIVY